MNPPKQTQVLRHHSTQRCSAGSREVWKGLRAGARERRKASKRSVEFTFWSFWDLVLFLFIRFLQIKLSSVIVFLCWFSGLLSKGDVWQFEALLKGLLKIKNQNKTKYAPLFYRLVQSQQFLFYQQLFLLFRCGRFEDLRAYSTCERIRYTSFYWTSAYLLCIIKSTFLWNPAMKFHTHLVRSHLISK